MKDINSIFKRQNIGDESVNGSSVKQSINDIMNVNSNSTSVYTTNNVVQDNNNNQQDYRQQLSNLVTD